MILRKLIVKKKKIRIRDLKNVLIVCLISCLLVFSGCKSVNGNINWPSPPKPFIKEVVVIPVNEANIRDDGFYMSNEDANNLADNVGELRAYNEKLEVLINKMKKYYGAK